MANRTIGINPASAQFLWESFASHCDWSSLLRELTQNELDAAATDVQLGVLTPRHIPHSDATAPKLFVYGNGIGFDPEKMADQLIGLFTSGREQGHDRNFGVGAKLVLFGLSPHGADYWTRPKTHPGVVYRARLSMINGSPSLVDLDGQGTLVQQLDASQAPGPLAKTSHGTLIVIHGNAPGHDTSQAPDGFVGGKRWVSRALNQRYFRFPKNVVVRASVEPDVFGSRAPIQIKSGLDVLNSYNPSPHSGSVKVTAKDHFGGAVKAVVHWYLIREGSKAPDSHGREQHGESFALLFQDECHAARYGAAARTVLDQFGVSYASKRVALYVELDDQWLPNKSRTNMERQGHGLDLALLGAQFKANLPEELVKAEQTGRRRLMQEGGKGKWRQKLFGLLPFLTAPALRKDNASTNQVTADQPGTVDRPGEGPDRVHSTKAENPAPRPTADRQGTSPGSDGGHRTRPTGFVMPQVRWVPETEMDDASHIAEWLPTRNEIRVNNDHPEVTAAVDHWKTKVIPVPDAQNAILDEAREMWTAQLIEQVLLTERLLQGSQAGPELFPVVLGTVFCQRLVPDVVLKQSVQAKHRNATW